MDKNVVLALCEGCEKEVPETKIFVCSSCGGEFCRSCMADINRDMICKECDIYVGKYSKYLEKDW